MDNIKPCECCGQDRPYPLQPGKWRFRTVSMPEGSWHEVMVKHDDEGLTMTYTGEDQPDWWPSYAQWEKVED